MISLRHLTVFALAVTAFGFTACQGAPDDGFVEEDEVPDEHLGVSAAALVPTDPVSAAVSGCTTSAVEGLSRQLVAELECLRPNTMKRIDNIPGITLRAGASASKVPFLQSSAADALVRVQKARGTTMTVVSALRVLPQQYLLYTWYRTGRCGIVLAAAPGTSNHESGLAVDVESNTGWRTAMAANTYRWYGTKDPPHFTYYGGGTVVLKGLSVKAFQRLWNRNNPNDTIAEDGAYGPMTEARLAKAPVGGFPKGPPANCNGSAPEPTPTPTDGGADAASEPPQEEDAGPEGSEIDEDAGDVSEIGDEATPPGPRRDSSAEDSEGCSVGAPGAPRGGEGAALVAVGLVCAFGLARGRARRARR